MSRGCWMVYFWLRFQMRVRYSELECQVFDPYCGTAVVAVGYAGKAVFASAACGVVFDLGLDELSGFGVDDGFV